MHDGFMVDWTSERMDDLLQKEKEKEKVTEKDQENDRTRCEQRFGYDISSI